MHFRYWRLIFFISAFFLFCDVSLKAQTQKVLNETYSKVYLAFAGPYASSPSSAFGHFFLVLEPSEKKTIHLWPAINFSADIESYSNLEQFIFGVFGGLKGFYSVLPFHEKIREYSNIESRPIYLLQLEFSSDEIQILKENIQTYIDSSKSFDYRFHDKNCASYISNELFLSSNKSITQSLTNTPRDLLVQIIERFNVNDIYKIESIESTFDNSLRDRTQENLIKISYNEAKLLLPFYEWKLNQQKTKLTSDQSVLINQLRIKASLADSSSSMNFLTLIHSNSFKIHNESAIDFGVTTSSLNQIYTTMSYRFALHDFFDFSEIYSENEFINLSNVQLQFNQNSFFVQDFWLFKQLSLSPSTKYVKRLSWSLELGFNRLPVISNELIPTLSGGIGKSYGNSNQLTSFLFHGLIRYDTKSYNYLLGKPEIIQRISFSKNVKLLHSVAFFLNTSTINNPSNYFEYSINAAFKLFDENNLIIRSTFTKSYSSFNFAYRAYF